MGKKKNAGWKFLNTPEQDSFSDSNGSYGDKHLDGSKYYSGLDGSWGYKNSDGTGYYSGTDGSWGSINKDGSSEYFGADESYECKDNYSENEEDNLAEDKSSVELMASLITLGAVVLVDKIGKKIKKEKQKKML